MYYDKFTCRGNTSYDLVQKEISSSMAVERVTTKKLELRAVTLTSELQNKVVVSTTSLAQHLP